MRARKSNLAPVRRRLASSVACVLILVMLPAFVWSQEPDDCEPLTARTADVLGERFGLDSEQRAWLETALRQGRLRVPGDLSALPGAGAELRERIEAAMCWVEPGRGEIRVAARSGSGAGYVETRLERTGTHVEAALRTRSDRNRSPRMRGAMKVRRGPVDVTAGTLTARRGLGLVLAAPGAQARGRTPLSDSPGAWRVSRSLDPAVGEGVAVAVRHAEWRVDVAGLENRLNDEPGSRWWAVGIDRLSAWGRVGATWVNFESETAWSLSAAGRSGRGSWGVEWAQKGSLSSRGLVWDTRWSSLTFRGSIVQADPGYRTVTGLAPPDEARASSTVARFDARWRLGVGRFVRVAHEVAAEPAGGWSERSRWLETEIQERVAPGLSLTVLWRSLEEDLAGAMTDSPPSQTVRFDISGRRAGWSTRFRIERRSNEVAGARWMSLGVGRGSGTAWQLRAARVDRPSRAPDLWWYRRRAGGLYAWDRLGDGAWIGAWARVPMGPVSIEGSVDGKPERWDVALALAWRGGG